MDSKNPQTITCNKVDLQDVLSLIKEKNVLFFTRKTLRLIFEIFCYIFSIGMVIIAFFAIDLSYTNEVEYHGTLFFVKVTNEDLQVMEVAVKVLSCIISFFSLILALYIGAVRKLHNRIRQGSKKLKIILESAELEAFDQSV